MNISNNFRSYIAEFIGTYLLVFSGTGAIVVNETANGIIGHLGIALSFGLIVMAVIYATGEISGAHINPAVTIAFWVSKKFSSQDLLPYIFAQISGAILASITLLILFPKATTLGGTLPANSILQAFVLEFILTFILMFVIINVSTGSKETGIMAGIAIGGTVSLEAILGGPISGASMNPARSIGPAIVSGNVDALWLYLVAPILGAILAIYSCRLIKGKDCCVEC